MRERTKLSDAMDAILSLEGDLSDARELYELAQEEGDSDAAEEVLELLRSAEERAQKAELEALLSGEADGNDCYVEIHAGAGGTESLDWAGMLRRMYVRWANAHDMKLEEVEEHVGDEAGIKSATLQIKGENAYGWLKSESGVHRLSGFHRSTLMRVAIPALPVSGFIRSLMNLSRSKLRTKTSVPTPIVQAVPAGSTSTKRTQLFD